MLGLLKRILGTKQDRDMGKYTGSVEEVNRYVAEYQNLSNDDLRQKTLEFRARIREYLRDIDAEIASINQHALDAEDAGTHPDDERDSGEVQG